MLDQPTILATLTSNPLVAMENHIIIVGFLTRRQYTLTCLGDVTLLYL